MKIVNAVGHIFFEIKVRRQQRETIEIHLKINNEIIDPNRYSFFTTTPFRFIITLPGKNDYQTVRRKKIDCFKNKSCEEKAKQKRKREREKDNCIDDDDDDEVDVNISSK